MRKLLTTAEQPQRVTMATRSKRATTVIPSDHTQKRARTVRSESNGNTPKRIRSDAVCSKCKKNDTSESLVGCKGSCSNKIHRSCVPAQFGRQGVHFWECDHCQTCNVCLKGAVKGATKFLKCYECLTSYHTTCYDVTSEQTILMVKEQRFCCMSCVKNRQPQGRPPIKSNRTIRRDTAFYQKNNRCVSINGSVGSRTATRNSSNGNDLAISSESEEFHGFNQSELTAHPIINRRSKSSEPSSVHKNLTNNNRSTIDGETTIPNASKWSKNEVYEYFKVKFPRHAHVFEDEEIDGESLYYLKREDVVGKFKIKIGPSLKIFNHIEKMQRMNSEK